MKRFGSTSLAVLATICLFSAMEPRAWGYSGYVDPGTGLLALQAIMSVAAASAYYLRRRIRALFGSNKDEKALAGPVSPNPENPHNPA